MTTKLRVAVADDEPDMREYLERILPRIGHQVVSASTNGRELVEHVKEFSPDIVITDIRMPNMDGIDAANEIDRHSAIPVILISAFNDPELIERVQSRHIMAYLVKPIKQADLAPAIALAMKQFSDLQTMRQEAKVLSQT